MKPSIHGTTVPITKAIRQKLRAEIKRTGITAIMLIKDAPDLPDGLTVAHVNRWIGGMINAAPARHVDYVVDRWTRMPDVENVKKDGKPLPNRGVRYADGEMRIELTEEMSKLLRAELVRTGIDHAKLLNELADVPTGLTARIVRGWLYREASTTSETHWNFVIAWLKAAPNLTAPLPIPIRKPSRRIYRPKAEGIEATNKD